MSTSLVVGYAGSSLLKPPVRTRFIPFASVYPIAPFQPSVQSARTVQTLSPVSFNYRLSSSRFSQASRAQFSSKADVFFAQETCPICLEEMKSGGGQAIYTAECCHSFHLSCISKNANERSSTNCPVCSRKLNNIHLPCIHEKLQIKTFTEFPAVAASHSISSFAVLLGLHAPPLPDDHNQRAPIDLVAVLDVSGSMFGSKLSLLQSAIEFVIDQMSPFDRLSLITFSWEARTILPLTKMSEEGRRFAKHAINSLYAGGNTNIVDGLNKGAQVLETCQMRNSVSSIILLSDGQDNCNPPAYLDLLSPSISSRNRESNQHLQRFPVHTFGVGEDHDSVAMNTISDASGGVFSFIESAKAIPTSFARCIGGLLSVVAQNVQLVLASASPGVEIKSIPSGRHESEISFDGKHGVIRVGDLYAEEKKEFLVNISIPEFSDTDQVEMEGKTSKTLLLDISCQYHNALSKELVQVKGQRIEILRPIAVSPDDVIVSLEVDRQRNRIAVAESIAKAKEKAEHGNIQGARRILDSTLESLRSSRSGQACDELVKMLEAELREIRERMRSKEIYRCSGRSYVLAGLSSHSSQRATTRSNRLSEDGSFLDADSVEYSYSCYDTPSSYGMVAKCKKAREN